MKTENIMNQKKSVGYSGSLPAYWQSRCATLFGENQKPLTMKEVGQLKQLGRYLLDDTKKTIDWALNNWWKFTQNVAALAGLSNVPTKPNVDGAIGFLLVHHAIAVNTMQPPAKEKQVVIPPPPTPSSPKPVIVKDKPATLEDVYRIEKEVEEETEGMTKEELKKYIANLQ